MRIVHILHGKVNPDGLNGVSKAGHWMATYQLRQGHDVQVWGIADSTSTACAPREYPMRLFSATPLRMILDRELKAALQSLEVHTWVQFHSVFCPEFPSIAGVLRKRKILYGVTPHGGYAKGVMAKNRWAKDLYWKLRERRYLAGARWIQAVGQGEARELHAMAPNAGIGWVPNGQVLDGMMGTNGPEARRVEAERPVAGFCGRLAIRQKGLDYLVQGFSAYKATGGRGELWLIGEDEDRAALERLAAEGGFGRAIRFFGAMAGAAKLELLAQIDVFIHCSRWEGLPTACLEAGAMGKALLVSRETNLAEFVEQCDAGLVLKETSAGGVWQALKQAEELYAKGGLARMGSNARSLVEREFNWENSARKFMAAIQDAGAKV